MGGVCQHCCAQCCYSLDEVRLQYSHGPRAQRSPHALLLLRLQHHPIDMFTFMTALSHASQANE